MITGLFGPTGVGKTAVSVALATEIQAEIVSVDSRQIYRELTAGTAKPPNEDLALVPHHFINERSLTDPITAGRYAAEARERIREIESRGKAVLLVGGSTLYVHALLFGLDNIPQSAPDVRASLQTRLEAEGLPALVDDLSRRDPDAYRQLDLANPRRVLRALEVLDTTGRPLSSFQTGGGDSTVPATVFVLDRDRPDLYRRIDARVDGMLDEGLIEEVKALLEMGVDPDIQALQSIGYKEVVRFLKGGETREVMVESVKRNTRRYAKRQLTWFRRYPAFRWLRMEENEGAGAVSSRLIRLLDAA